MAYLRLDIDANKFYMYGVSGYKNYGLLNDPSLTSTISPITKAATGFLWADATTIEIYNDCLKLFAGLVTQMDGLVDAKNAIKISITACTCC